MKKHVHIALIIFFLSFQATAQELRFGLVTGMNIYQKTELNLATLSPPDSYYTYSEKSQGEGLINKHGIFNAFNVGGAFKFSYKRFSLNIEPQYYYQRTTISFEKPYGIRRLFGKKAFRMPIYFTYKFFKKENSLFLLAGLGLNKEKNWDIQDPGINYYLGGDEIYEYSVDGDYGISPSQFADFGNDHFAQILYDDLPYWNYMVGFGRTFGRYNASFRFQSRFDITKHQQLAEIGQIEFSLTFLFLSTKDFTEKHFLYVD